MQRDCCVTVVILSLCQVKTQSRQSALQPVSCPGFSLLMLAEQIFFFWATVLFPLISAVAFTCFFFFFCNPMHKSGVCESEFLLVWMSGKSERICSHSAFSWRIGMCVFFILQVSYQVSSWCEENFHDQKCDSLGKKMGKKSVSSRQILLVHLGRILLKAGSRSSPKLKL